MKANEVQGTDDWMRSRAGRFTSSRAADLMAVTKSGPSTSRANLLALLAVERLTGECVTTYQTAAMQRGIDTEAEARDAFSFAHLCTVEECGSIVCDDLPNTSSSPDGLIGHDELVEIKCPSAMMKHVEALRSGAHANEYRWQIQHQLMVTGRKRTYVVSYDPRFGEGLSLAVTIVERDEAAIASLREAIINADAEVEAIVQELQQLKESA